MSEDVKTVCIRCGCLTRNIGTAVCDLCVEEEYADRKLSENLKNLRATLRKQRTERTDEDRPDRSYSKRKG